MPKPWTMPSFLAKLLECLREADWRHRVDIVETLVQIHRDENLACIRDVQNTLLGILGDHENPPSCLDPYSKDFLLSTLRLLHGLNMWNRDFYAELMVQFLEGDKDVR